jgi:hypothetical protein
MVIVRDSKISFVWGSVFADHLWGEHGADPALWRKPHYVLEYNRIRGGTGGPYLDFAWYEGEKSAFWRYYLGNRALAGVSGPDAWEAVVPFRIRTQIPDVTTDLGERVVIDTYGHELGVTVVLTVQPFKRATAPLADWVARLTQLRRDPVYLLVGDPNQAHMTLAQVLDAIGQKLRLDNYAGGGASVTSYEPISIANILQASGGRPRVKVDQTLQRHLHAVTAWPIHWQTVALPSLDASPPFLPVGGSNRFDNDALYVSGRGIAVWRPGLFAPPDPGSGRRRHTLSCLGHNLSAAAAQAEYFRLVAVAYAAQKKLQDRLDIGRVRAIGSRIDALLSGAGTTYRSRAVRQLLADPNSRTQVNALLAMVGGTPI